MSSFQTSEYADWPKVTFGMIVLNGEPYIRYNLRSLYPFAHEIIVVEGAAGDHGTTIATDDGHSLDGTLKTLYQFKIEEDPDDKVTIVTAEDHGYSNGFWLGEKDEQSQAYATRATAEYLWQVDVDEFYKSRDIRRILELLRDDPDITTMSFKTITFWGSLNYVVDGWYLRRGGDTFYRLFKWGPGYRYVSHRPPTVYDEKGQDLREQKLVDASDPTDAGIFLYHAAFIFPRQVRNKSEYYSSASWANHASQSREWAERNFIQIGNPYRVHNEYNYPSWVERFHGQLPRPLDQLDIDLREGRLSIETRPTADIERLVTSFRYRLGVAILKLIEPIYRLCRACLDWARHILIHLPKGRRVKGQLRRLWLHALNR